MHIPDRVLDEIRTNGYALMEGFLSPNELVAARRATFEVFPEGEVYFANPDAYAHLVKHPFAGLRVGPFAHWDINRLTFHPDLVDAAERYCGTTDLMLYKTELWAKYSGSVDYDQQYHRDFDNHNLVVPRRDGKWPQLTNFILLSDVTEANGPTNVITRQIGDEIALMPNRIAIEEMAGREVRITGPAGSIFMYNTDTLHRGSALTGDQQSRFMLLADYCARGNPWMGKICWPGSANKGDWAELLARTTPRERDLFGFPPPGHEYWNQQTRRDVALRWPGIDMSAY
jgi:Phytanoyl-CoA dioxygenase (PhyH)